MSIPFKIIANGIRQGIHAGFTTIHIFQISRVLLLENYYYMYASMCSHMSHPQLYLTHPVRVTNPRVGKLVVVPSKYNTVLMSSVWTRKWSRELVILVLCDVKYNGVNVSCVALPYTYILIAFANKLFVFFYFQPKYHEKNELLRWHYQVSSLRL